MFLDEDVPQPMRRALRAHYVRTVADMSWGGISNGELLRLVEDSNFDVFVTGGKNLPHQQNLSNRALAIVVLSAISWPVIKKHLPKIAQAVETVRPDTVMTVQCGLFVRRRTKWNARGSAATGDSTLADPPTRMFVCDTSLCGYA